MDVGTIIVMVFVPLGIAGFGFWSNWKIKKLEVEQREIDRDNQIKQKEIDREYQIKGPWIQRSLDVLAESHYWAFTATHVSLGYHDATGKRKTDLDARILEAVEFWQRNLLFLPLDMQREILLFSRKMGDARFSPDSSPLAKDKTMEAYGELLKKITHAHESLAKRYGVYDGLDNA